MYLQIWHKMDFTGYGWLISQSTDFFINTNIFQFQDNAEHVDLASGK